MGHSRPMQKRRRPVHVRCPPKTEQDAIIKRRFAQSKWRRQPLPSSCLRALTPAIFAADRSVQVLDIRPQPCRSAMARTAPASTAQASGHDGRADRARATPPRSPPATDAAAAPHRCNVGSGNRAPFRDCEQQRPQVARRRTKTWLK